MTGGLQEPGAEEGIHPSVSYPVHPRARARVSCFVAVARVVGFCGFSLSCRYSSMATAELVLCVELLKCKYQVGIIEIYFLQQKREVCLLAK